MKYLKYIIFVTALSAFSCSQEKVQTTDQLTKAGITSPDMHTVLRRDSAAAYQLDTFFTRRFRNGGFNGSVLFAEHGRVVYKKTFGYADLTHRIKITPDTKFQLASVSKQFTAFAVMLCVKRGLLSYSDDISKFFPYLPYHDITIKELLTHHSGLPNYMYFSEKYWPDKMKYMNNKDVLGMLQKYKPDPYFSPGRRFFYSNTGYLLLASIVEKVTHQSFPSFLEKEIFRPLGMNHTFIYNRKDEFEVDGVAVGYYTPRRRAEDSFMNGVYGDKGVVSTVDDLLKWDQALYAGKLIGSKMLEEAFIPSDSTRIEKSYGYGWRILNSDSTEKIVYHGGLWKGFRTLFIRKLNEQKTIIVLSNVASSHLHMKDVTNLF